ncbi:hypothetical protein M427DRAFT_157711 [Gonapodya prolifera JEL478]|uniref:Uncharacterized protein n=1 Tax=Gonapodya prolifera (strain JEL478) TaxID=1344416 RepID=A0A139A4Y0_GONPJ|nr:hypothetical protein M427DRAFT_157711 [Gonapodya prolifera JEL478]|eukprot:KXS11867.1 hypothetical protein M427DRAFT_157711 [Gonapodya prolifera JEL478]
MEHRVRRSENVTRQSFILRDTHGDGVRVSNNSQRKGMRKNVLHTILLVGALTCLVSHTIMQRVDDRMHISADTDYGGAYGKGAWYMTPSNFSAEVVSDLSQWALLNLVRGLTGLLTWLAIVCTMANDRESGSVVPLPRYLASMNHHSNETSTGEPIKTLKDR